MIILYSKLSVVITTTKYGYSKLVSCFKRVVFIGILNKILIIMNIYYVCRYNTYFYNNYDIQVGTANNIIPK